MGSVQAHVNILRHYQSIVENHPDPMVRRVSILGRADSNGADMILMGSGKAIYDSRESAMEVEITSAKHTVLGAGGVMVGVGATSPSPITGHTHPGKQEIVAVPQEPAKPTVFDKARAWAGKKRKKFRQIVRTLKHFEGEQVIGAKGHCIFEVKTEGWGIIKLIAVSQEDKDDSSTYLHIDIEMDNKGKVAIGNDGFQYRCKGDESFVTWGDIQQDEKWMNPQEFHRMHQVEEYIIRTLADYISPEGE